IPGNNKAASGASRRTSASLETRFLPRSHRHSRTGAEGILSALALRLFEQVPFRQTQISLHNPELVFDSKRFPSRKLLDRYPRIRSVGPKTTRSSQLTR